MPLKIIAHEFSGLDPQRFQCFRAARPPEIIRKFVNLPGPMNQGSPHEWSPEAIQAAREFVQQFGILRESQDKPEDLLKLAIGWRWLWDADCPNHLKARVWLDTFEPFSRSVSLGELNRKGKKFPTSGWIDLKTISPDAGRQFASEAMHFDPAFWVDWGAGEMTIKARDPLDALAYEIFLKRRLLRFCAKSDCRKRFVASHSREIHCSDGCKIWATTQRQARWRKKKIGKGKRVQSKGAKRGKK